MAARTGGRQPLTVDRRRIMDEVKADVKKRTSRRNAAIAGGIFLAIVVGFVLTHRKNGKTVEAEAAAQPPAAVNDVIEPTPEQLAQVHVEPVREQLIDVDLQTTGKVGFNEDRLTPVFAPYGGRVLEVLANKGDLVAIGQPLLVIESPDLVAAVNDLAEA